MGTHSVYLNSDDGIMTTHHFTVRFAYTLIGIVSKVPCTLPPTPLPRKDMKRKEKGNEANFYPFIFELRIYQGVVH